MLYFSGMLKQTFQRRVAAAGVAILASFSGAAQAMAASIPLTPESKAYLEGIDSRLKWRQQDQRFTRFHQNNPALQAHADAGAACVEQSIDGINQAGGYDTFKHFAPRVDNVVDLIHTNDTSLTYNKVVNAAALRCAERRMANPATSWTMDQTPELRQYRVYCNAMPYWYNDNVNQFQVSPC